MVKQPFSFSSNLAKEKLSYSIIMRVVILDSSGFFLTSLLNTHELKCVYLYQLASSSCETRKKNCIKNNSPTFSEE